MVRLMSGSEIARRRGHRVARVRAYQLRQRDEHGRFAPEGDEPRAVMLSVRVTPGEMAAIAEIAVTHDKTVTALILDAVRVYGHGADRAARTIDRRGLGL